MSDFTSLPQHHINYPIFRPEPIPQRPIIPTAEYAAQLARTTAAVMANLNPEERKRKQAELDLLGARLREQTLSNQLRELQLGQVQQHIQANNALNDVLKNKLGKTGSAVTDHSPGTFEPRPVGFPTTDLENYYAPQKDKDMTAWGDTSLESESPEEDAAPGDNEQEEAAP